LKSVRTTHLYLIAGLALALPGASIAQTRPDSSSVEYCNKLANVYSAQHNLYETITADRAVAIARCNTDPNASIATLEQAMKDAHIEIPSSGHSISESPKR
jgi:hypothetical protein